MRLVVTAAMLQPGDVVLFDAIPIPVGHKVISVTDVAPANVVVAYEDGRRDGMRYDATVTIDREA